MIPIKKEFQADIPIYSNQRNHRVECVTLFGERIVLPADKLILRASAYAVAVNKKHVLLIKMKSTKKYYLPGGGCRTGERLEAALKREVLEETGIRVQIHQMMHFQEVFFYYDPFDEAYHSLQFFYCCSPLSFGLISNAEIHDQEAENPQWVPIESLDASSFQDHGAILIKLIHEASADPDNEADL